MFLFDCIQIFKRLSISTDVVVSDLILSEPATVQNPTAVHSARDDFLKVHNNRHINQYINI